jgi:hypothetical protein
MRTPAFDKTHVLLRLRAIKVHCIHKIKSVSTTQRHCADTVLRISY